MVKHVPGDTTFTSNSSVAKTNGFSYGVDLSTNGASKIESIYIKNNDSALGGFVHLHDDNQYRCAEDGVTKKSGLGAIVDPTELKKLINASLENPEHTVTFNGKDINKIRKTAEDLISKIGTYKVKEVKLEGTTKELQEAKEKSIS